MKWIRVFKSIKEMESKLPVKELRKLVFGSRNICLARTATDVFAFDNSCPHMGETLHKGKINIHNEIVCPLHEYQFKLKTGAEANSSCGGLEKYPVKKDETGLYIGIN